MNIYTKNRSLYETIDCLNSRLFRKLNNGHLFNPDLESELDSKLSDMLYDNLKEILRYDLLDILNNNIKYEFK